VVVVELSAGQLIEDVRLAVEGDVPVFFHGRTGGVVPTPGDVLKAVRRAWALTAPAAAMRATTSEVR
jgi:2-oxoglutarate ferredoxin oxidoreductase subunit alpha